MGAFQLADQIEDLLRAPDGEGGDDHVAAAVERALDHVGKEMDRIGVVVVQPVAVSGFHNDIIGLVNVVHRADDRHVAVAEVAAEDDLFRLAALGQPDLDRGRAEQMTGVDKAQRDVVADVDELADLAGAEAVDSRLHVVKVVHRLIDVLAGTLGLAVLPFGLLHLDVRAVAQHDVTEIGRRLGQIDPAAKTVLAQQRQSSGVVDVGVRDQHEVKRRRLDRQILVDEYVLALLHAEVHQTAPSAYLEIGAAAGDLVRCAEKRDFHLFMPPCPDFL